MRRHIGNVMSRGQMTQALLQTSGFYLGPGFAKNASQGDRVMWLLLALLLFFFLGEQGWGLGNLVLQGAGP